jgi:hypothetical protein
MVAFSVLLVACGGGGGSGGTTPTTPAPAPSPTVALPTANSISLQSDQGDPIGQGKSYQYTSANARITVTASKNLLVVKVEGDEQWTGAFQTGANAAELKVGEYSALPLYLDNMDPALGGMTWWGEGRTCTTSTGWVAIDNVAYNNGQLAAISLRFQRNCNGATAALRGTVNYTVNDKATFTTPVSPPGDLWSPPASVTATSGNYAYFESAAGDYVGLGKTYLFDRRSALITVSGLGPAINIRVAGDDVWQAEIRSPSALGRLVTGYYANVTGARFNNPLTGGISWTGAGRGCSKSKGWFMVDAVDYEIGGTLTRLNLRFEQHCEGREAPLRGVIHYDSASEPYASPVVSSIGSWRAPAALLPATDNFLYVESDAYQPVAQGLTDLATSGNAAFQVDVDGTTLWVNVYGNRQWGVKFQPPARYAQIVPGNYDGVTTPPGDSVSFGSLSVSKDAYGCSAEQGWVVVDSASYAAGKLVAIELRFEQLCPAGPTQPKQGILHGHLRWRADVPSKFAGPVAAPDLFWRPAATLPTGNHIYLLSDRSDFIAAGETLFTPVDSEIKLTEQDGKLDIVVNGDTQWSGRFETMSTAGTILPGYYAGLTDSFVRPARGRFRWSGEARACSTSSSGVVVDSAVYTGGKLSELQLRFEQHCDNAPGALRGQIHWFASDTRQPAGPRTAVPGSLWSAAAGTLPASGNYLYVQSTPGDPIGVGKTYLLTPNNATFNVSTTPSLIDPTAGFLSLTADSGASLPNQGRFRLEFQTMRSISQLQPGFYDHLLGLPSHNPAFGGLNVDSMVLGCESVTGWVVLDRVTYTNGRPSAIHGRFEQYCDGRSTPLHGEFNWEG